MNTHDPILKSMIDDDLYKLTQGSVAFHLFPDARVKYKFINRGGTKFPKGFANALKAEIWSAAKLYLKVAEMDFLKEKTPLRRTYVDWLSGYRLDPSEVKITGDGEDMEIEVAGYWYRVIYWEVKLMAIISELYFRMTGQPMEDGWDTKIEDKAERLYNASCKWSDFGTRRRYSYEVQDKVVKIMSGYDGFLGTSNPHLAMKYGVVPIGTYAHESVMAMSALYGPKLANKMWMKHWSEHYNGNLGIALTDTFTTKVFLEDFGSYEARLFDGVRHDSDDPIRWGYNMLKHYEGLKIDAHNKRFVFSDGLNTDKFIEITNTFKGLCQVVGGIGTHLTNDVGERVIPLNMVIKMTEADFGKGWVNVVKLSDNAGKHTGHTDTINHTQVELGLITTY
jgi:nicotinate phosphoribosyltransferase